MPVVRSGATAPAPIDRTVRVTHFPCVGCILKGTGERLPDRRRPRAYATFVDSPGRQGRSGARMTSQRCAGFRRGRLMSRRPTAPTPLAQRHPSDRTLRHRPSLFRTKVFRTPLGGTATRAKARFRWSLHQEQPGTAASPQKNSACSQAEPKGHRQLLRRRSQSLTPFSFPLPIDPPARLARPMLGRTDKALASGLAQIAPIGPSPTADRGRAYVWPGLSL